MKAIMLILCLVCIMVCSCDGNYEKEDGIIYNYSETLTDDSGTECYTVSRWAGLYMWHIDQCTVCVNKTYCMHKENPFDITTCITPIELRHNKANIVYWKYEIESPTLIVNIPTYKTGELPRGFCSDWYVAAKKEDKQ